MIVKDATTDRVRGLTTAATIWLTAALGVACGLGHWVLALLAAVLGLVILVIGGPIEKYLHHRFPQKPDPPEALP